MTPIETFTMTRTQTILILVFLNILIFAVSYTFVLDIQTVLEAPWSYIIFAGVILLVFKPFSDVCLSLKNSTKLSATTKVMFQISLTTTTVYLVWRLPLVLGVPSTNGVGLIHFFFLLGSLFGVHKFEMWLLGRLP